MLSGMAIPGDIVGEDASSDHLISCGPHQAPDVRRQTSGARLWRHFTPPLTRKTRERKKTRKPSYKGYGVMYLPADIKGLTDKLHLLLPKFFAGNTTLRNELVHVLDALLRLKQLTRRGYTDINNRLT